MIQRRQTHAWSPHGLRGDRAMSLRRLGIIVGLACVIALLTSPVAADQARPPWRNQAQDLPTTTMLIGDDAIEVEIAATPESRSRGLGYRAELEPGTGMLFVQGEPRTASFWMKGMRFCLDIVWIERGRIVGAAESVCPEPPGSPVTALPSYKSPVPVSYVLEVPAGWLAVNGHEPGTSVEFTLPPGL